MASLSEMMAYADYTGKVKNPFPVVAEGALQGFIAGQEHARALKQQQLETTLKILDIQEKMKKIQISERQQQLGENFAKAAGLMPMDDKENAVAVNHAFNTMGEDMSPVINTPENKVAKMFREGKLRASWSTKSGFTVSVADKNSAGRALSGATELQAQKADLAEAEKMARSEMEKSIAKDALGRPVQKAKDAPVPPDLIAKYLPIATSLRTKDLKTYKRLMANIEPPKEDPTKVLLSQIADLNTKLEAAKNEPSWLEKTFKVGRAKPSDQTGIGVDMKKKKKIETAGSQITDDPNIWGNFSMNDNSDNEE